MSDITAIPVKEKCQMSVVGPRVLLRVIKFDSKKDSTYKGTSILMAETAVDHEVSNQTAGEIVDIGDDCFKGITNNIPKLGDIVRFNRFGAVRAYTTDDNEYWCMLGKDIMLIDQRYKTLEDVYK